jgi:hypothetical protein
MCTLHGTIVASLAVSAADCGFKTASSRVPVECADESPCVYAQLVLE